MKGPVAMFFIFDSLTGNSWWLQSPKGSRKEEENPRVSFN